MDWLTAWVWGNSYHEWQVNWIQRLVSNFFPKIEKKLSKKNFEKKKIEKVEGKNETGKELFSNKNSKTPCRHLLSGIENIYSDPESYQFYFIQSEGGCLYDIATSVDFDLDPNERLKSLSETLFRHRPNGSGSRTNQNRLSNSLVKARIPGPLVLQPTQSQLVWAFLRIPGQRKLPLDVQILTVEEFQF